MKKKLILSIQNKEEQKIFRIFNSEIAGSILKQGPAIVLQVSIAVKTDVLGI